MHKSSQLPSGQYRADDVHPPMGRGTPVAVADECPVPCDHQRRQTQPSLPDSTLIFLPPSSSRHLLSPEPDPLPLARTSDRSASAEQFKVHRINPNRPADPVLKLMVIGVAVLFGCVTSAGCTWVRALVKDPNEESHRLVQEARAAEERDEIAEAAKLLSRAARTTPEDPEVHRQLARVLFGQGHHDAAVEHLQYAVDQDPADPAAFVQLAHILSHEGNELEAGLAVDAALELDPNHTEALLLKASLAEKANQIEDALQTYHRVLNCDPTNVEAMLAVARLQEASGRPDRAAPLLRSVCEASSSTPQQKARAQWLLGIAYGRQRRWDDAAAALSESLAHRNDATAEDWYRLAFARFQSGDYEGSRRDLVKALELDPRHAASLTMSAALQPPGHPPPLTLVTAQLSMGNLPIPAGW